MSKLRSEMDSGETGKKKRRAKIITELKRYGLSSLLFAALIGTVIAHEHMCDPPTHQSARMKNFKRNLYPPSLELDVLVEDILAGMKEQNENTEKRE